MSIGISWYVLTVNLDVTHLYLIIDCFIKGGCFHLFFFFLTLGLLQKEGKESTRNKSKFGIIDGKS